MENDTADTGPTISSQRRWQFRLRTLLLVPVIVAALLVMWFWLIRPRLAFENRRQESISRLDWGSKDAEAEYRTKQIQATLEQANYGNISVPTLAYAAVRKRSGHLIVDWVVGDVHSDVQGIELTGNETIQIPFDADYVEHNAGTLIVSTAITKDDAPANWQRVIDSGKYEAALMISDELRSNKVELRIVD